MSVETSDITTGSSDNSDTKLWASCVQMGPSVTMLRSRRSLAIPTLRTSTRFWSVEPNASPNKFSAALIYCGGFGPNKCEWFTRLGFLYCFGSNCHNCQIIIYQDMKRVAHSVLKQITISKNIMHGRVSRIIIYTALIGLPSVNWDNSDEVQEQWAQATHFSCPPPERHFSYSVFPPAKLQASLKVGGHGEFRRRSSLGSV